MTNKINIKEICNIIEENITKNSELINERTDFINKISNLIDNKGNNMSCAKSKLFVNLLENVINVSILIL